MSERHTELEARLNREDLRFVAPTPRAAPRWPHPDANADQSRYSGRIRRAPVVTRRAFAPVELPAEASSPRPWLDRILVAAMVGGSTWIALAVIVKLFGKLF